MKILIACEESQAVCKEFRALGHEAYSCDIEPCSGGHPEWHLQQDVLPLLKEHWDMIIAFPPCTYLCVSGMHWTRRGLRPQKFTDQAVDFFITIAKSKCEKIAIENPIGIMSKLWRKPDQIIQPFQFGDNASKKTCLWLKNLPPLNPTKILPLPECGCWANQTPSGQNKLGPSPERAKLRSKTFPGIAKAMAEQWGREAQDGK